MDFEYWQLLFKYLLPDLLANIYMYTYIYVYVYIMFLFSDISVRIVF